MMKKCGTSKKIIKKVKKGVDKLNPTCYNKSVKRIDKGERNMKKLLNKEIALDMENNDWIITVGQMIGIAACLVGLGICLGLVI